MSSTAVIQKQKARFEPDLSQAARKINRVLS